VQADKAEGIEATVDDKPSINEDEHAQAHATGMHQTHFLPAKTWREELRPWSYYGKDSLIQFIWRPFPFFLSPVVWFAVFAYGMPVVFLVIISVVNATVFAMAPYHFNAQKTGFTSVGPLIGSIVAAAIAGPAVDYSTKWFARRNHGIYEPESRLFIILPSMVLVVVGLSGWAVMTPHHVKWIGPVVMYGLINFGQAMGANGSYTYLLDCHRNNASETFAIVNVCKDIILWGLSTKFNGWIAKKGVFTMFFIVAGICGGSMLTCVPMYIYGKRCRHWMSKQRIFNAQS